MADCCSEIKAELAALKAEVAKLKPVDEKKIIEQSIFGAKEAIIPIIGLKIGEAITQKVAPLSLRLIKVEDLTGKTAQQAREALERAFQAGTNASTAIKTAGEAVKGASDAAATAGAARAVSGAALARVLALAATVASLVASVASLATSIATLLVLGNRVDQVEKSVDVLGNSVSQIFGFLLPIKNLAQLAKITADGATTIASDARTTARIADANSSRANATANDAIEKANVAVNRAEQNTKIAQQAISSANKAVTDANIAKVQAEQAIATATTANGNAQKAINDAQVASSQAQLAQTKAQEAINEANTISSKAQQAIAQAGQATETARTAIGKANQAESRATNAEAKANQLQSKINQLQGELSGVTAIIPTLTSGLSTAANIANEANNLATKALNQARTATTPDLTPIQNDLDQKFNKLVQENNNKLGIQGLKLSELQQDFNKKFEDFKRQTQMDSDSLYQEFTRRNNQLLNIQGITKNQLSQEFDKKLEQLKRESSAGLDTRFKEAIEQNQKALEPVKSKLQAVERNNTQIQQKIREGEELNKQGIAKLDQLIPMVAGIPLVVGRASNDIQRAIPTIPQLETAAATGTCRTTRPGGCMNKALNDSANQINANTANQANNLLNAFSAGSNVAQMTLLNTINTKLGAQLPNGGISGKLERFSKWMQLDRLLNMLTFAATIHNAFMLSNDVGQTLLGAINNVLQFIGLKDDKGENIDVGQIISSTIENTIKAIVGTENYQAITTSWAKANRIYQATTNVVMSFSNIGHTIVNGLEIIGGMNGKIGNALRIWGVVGERAYQWFNPQPNFHSKMFRFFENAQQGASTIQIVTQAPLDVVNAVTEFNNSTTELVKAVKEDPNVPNKGAQIQDAQQVKAAQEQIKTVSQGVLTTLNDVFNAND